MNAKKSLHLALRSLWGMVPRLIDGEDIGGVCHRVGICNNVRSLLSKVSEYSEDVDVYGASRLLDELVERWPRSCGSPHFPVGGEREYLKKDQLWRNPRRVELLHWMIMETK